jgi:anti-anti-sigma regulatory factor
MTQPDERMGVRPVKSENIVRSSVSGDRLTLQLGTRFDFDCHQSFRRAYESPPGPFHEYVVDLASTDYVDSAALGMLLVLRDRAGSAKVRVINSRPAARKVFQIANFATLFDIA